MAVTPQDRINGSSKKTAQSSEIKVTPPAPAGSEACPYIGLEDDPGTRLLYVAPVAFCHRAEPAGAVDLNHQQAYCLASMHMLCPVFMRPEWDVLPAALQYQEPESPTARKRWFWLAAALLVLGLIVGGWLIGGNGRFPTIVETKPEANVPVIAVVSTPTPTPTMVVSPTTVPTKTAVPTVTASATNTNTPAPTATATALPTATLVPTYTPRPATFTPLPPTETAVPLVEAVVNVPFLNVRSGPGIAYELIATIAEGDQIELTGRVSDGSWWQFCCVNGEPGWVIGEAVDMPENAEALVPRANRIPPLPTPDVEP
ncbi:MAG: SH3 domain-containing protein [Anaerolineae bacterium]|nr:SH3 domain-containing protein [Anaerolineae bacterium]